MSTNTESRPRNLLDSSIHAVVRYSVSQAEGISGIFNSIFNLDATLGRRFWEGGESSFMLLEAPISRGAPLVTAQCLVREIRDSHRDEHFHFLQSPYISVYGV